MSTNEKRQNEHEKKCIDIIKSKFSVQNCFGLTTENYSVMERWLEEIIPNTSSNEFPDFVFSNGFIEHFMITSSKSDSKGSSHKIAELKFHEKNVESAKKLSNQQPNYRNSLKYSSHSYSNLVKSFKNTWNKHINSLEHYQRKNDKGVFLVEYFDIAALSMAELSLEGVNELFIGDYPVKQEHVDSYRLSRDKYMLKWLYQFADRIEYIIFLTEEHVEFIKLSNILNLLTVLPYDYAIGSNVTILTDGGTLL